MTQINQLSNREWEVVNQLLQGKSNKLIASSLGISDRTVEFHLKNIYAKFQVSSRIELILKLANTTGKVKIQKIEKLGVSTVDSLGESAENRDAPDPRTDRLPSFRDTISMIGKELEMKNLLNSKHVGMGVSAALLTGLLSVAMLQHFGHMSLNKITPWILPLVVMLAMIGLSVGLMGKRNGNTPGKVFFSTLFGTGLSQFAIFPVLLIVVLPLGKLAEWAGLVNRSAMTSDVASMLVITAMMAIWLIVGTAIGILLLSVTIKRPGHADVQRHAAEHGL